jgi:alpha-ketoglutarate-dependent taurine dioxygenase
MRYGERVSQALAELPERGWVVFSGGLEDVSEYAEREGWKPVTLRRGDEVVSDLRSVGTAEARPNSMSSRTGLGAQPLHTDGAHLAYPPDVVALAAASSHRAATRLWASHGADAPWDDLRHGVFRVSDGRAHRHRFAADGDSIRFDPCCMTPLDARSRRVTGFFQRALKQSDRHQWAGDGPEVLLIDNRRTLHAREAVDPADPPRHLARIAFQLPEAA